MATTVQQIRNRVVAATPKAWRYAAGHLVATVRGEDRPVGSIAAERSEDLELIEHAREDLEYLLGIIDAQEAAVGASKVEAEAWKRRAIGEEQYAAITGSTVLAAIIEQYCDSEVFIPDELMQRQVSDATLSVWRDEARRGNVYVVRVQPSIARS